MASTEISNFQSKGSPDKNRQEDRQYGDCQRDGKIFHNETRSGLTIFMQLQSHIDA
jgi:hypothetical protein